MSSQKKKINLIVEDSCKDCPYCILESEPYYASDFYYYCDHPDDKVNSIKNMVKEDWPPIPDDCPLDDVNEQT